MLKLKLQCFGHLMRRPDSLEKTLMLGKTEGRRTGRAEAEMVGWGRTEAEMDGVTHSMGMSLSRLQEMVKDKEAWRAAVHGSKELDVTEQLSSNSECIHTYSFSYSFPLWSLSQDTKCSSLCCTVRQPVLCTVM